ncbi:hypothetical protein CVT26_009523 [Gymnopilus dilepis]|uniref:Uncharacterized protein n=1 Tax=Gymnopilus dilepis TaxID=231916 RepID=A0A409VKB7_9AGAR|nr:hypothetical protein CVT26_009523 [Gymnopilus dilepis]
MSNFHSKYPTAISPTRKSHRRRVSALRLSSDTTTSLPECISTAGWGHQNQRPSTVSAEEEDRPPDYPDSAEEADEDTDTENNVVYLPPLASPSLRPQTASPRRAKRFQPAHRRRHSTQRSAESSGDPYLDSLLERSVHALEMSNTLLQSSISTQTSLSAILANDSPADMTLEARAVGLSSRIKDTWDVRETWAHDLEAISRDVEGLFIEAPNNSSPTSMSRRHSPRSAHSIQGSVSSSLPSGGSMAMHKGRRRPSLDLRRPSATSDIEAADDQGLPRLHYSQQNRENLISPPPRALTQYVASTQEENSLLLPSTIGVRSQPHIYQTPDWKPLSDVASSSTTSLLSTQSFTSPSLPPKLTDKPLEPSTPAYNMLSSFVTQRTPSSGSNTPSTSFTSSFMPRRRDSSKASSSTERSIGIVRRRSSPSPTPLKTPDGSHRQDRHLNQTPKRGVSPLAATVRPMTPPVEESSSSSSDGYVAKRTVQSLRKILDDQPVAEPSSRTSRSASINGQRLRPPAFMPRTPATVVEAGTSTTTASISRLFTKGKHTSSTRAPSPPRQSAMKRSAPPSALHSPSLSVSNSMGSAVPSPTATSLSIPDLVSKVLRGGSVGTPSSSGQSTPSKRISFAELPESYASTRPPSSRFSKASKAARKRKGKGKLVDVASNGYGSEGNDDLLGGGGRWWGGWLNPGGSGLYGLGASLARQEEKMEDRMTRSWGGRLNAGFGGGLDEWAV